MAINTIEENEMPEHYSLFTLTHNRKPADGVGQVVLAAPGHHPKCRIVSVKHTVLAYAAAVDVFAVEDGDGNDAATLDGGAAIGISTEGALVAGQVFERNEAICANLTTDGNAANAGILTVLLESIH